METLIGKIGRRDLLLGTVFGSLSWLLGAPLRASQFGRLGCCSGDDPMGCLRCHRYDVLVATLEAQLCCLWGGEPADDPHAVAQDVLAFVESLDFPLQRGICGALGWIDLYAVRHTFRRLSKLSIDERRAVLNQGEYPVGRRGTARLIRWECDYVLHTAISAIAMLGRLVTHSRHPARTLVRMTWSSACQEPSSLVHMPAPSYPDLSQPYDVCIVGSGAGGAVVAARAAQEGLRVILVESGDWVSPDALVDRVDGDKGMVIQPARDDHVLMRLYRNSGVQIAGNLTGLVRSRLDLLLPWRRHQIAPRQTINVIQADVVGGGPYVNNAIHLRIKEHVWNRWKERRPPGVDYQQLCQRMQQIELELGVNETAVWKGAGERSWRFVEGARLLGCEVKPTPVSIREHGFPCGSDNSVDPFGNHVGGLHPYDPFGPNSYLMRALHASPPAVVAYRTRAEAFDLVASTGGVTVEALLAEDRRGVAKGAAGRPVRIRARYYVLAAGAVASTQLLRASLDRRGLTARGLGQRFTANVVAPVYAIYDRPVRSPDSQRPEPGIAQCFFIEPKYESDGRSWRIVEPAIENWFHYPGSLAIAVTGWFDEYARLMRRYENMVIAGMVVPTKVRPENRILPDGRIELELDNEEFELLLKGIECIGEIFLAAATADNGVALYLPTKAILLDACQRPVEIRDARQLRWALDEVRRRGPAFLNLCTAHPQGGNPLGDVVDPASFRVQLEDGRIVGNLFVADASIFPAGCEVNPQLTVKALASFAADSLIALVKRPTT